MKRRLFTIILAAIICAAAYIAIGVSTRHSVGIAPVYAATEITAREVTVDGATAGEVVANGNDVLFRVRTSLGGQTPYERAQVVADRLNRLMSSGTVTRQDVTTSRENGQEVVLVKGQVIATASAEEARLNHTTPFALANSWAGRIQSVVAGLPPEETPVAEKIVPIISVGSGLRVGGALVTGDRDRVHEVKAVAQLDANFSKSVRVRVLVPVATTNVVSNIRRVPGTSVAGLVDIKL